MKIVCEDASGKGKLVSELYLVLTCGVLVFDAF